MTNENNINIDEIIIESDNIYTSGFVMEKTYQSINRGN